MAVYNLGRLDWDLNSDDEGHRHYMIKWLLAVDDYEDGPNIIYNSAAIPAVGDSWAFGNDIDPWAFCQPGARFSPVITKEPNRHWIAEQKFSTAPIGSAAGFKRIRCQDTQIESPFAEPPRISGSFVRYIKEATKDRHGNQLLNTAYERIRGKLVEQEVFHPKVDIEINSLNLDLPTICPMIGRLNDSFLWGLNPRMVRFADFNWQRLVYGTCTFYYVLRFSFEIDFDTFDKPILSEGKKCLLGWSPSNPAGARLDPLGLDPDALPALKYNWQNPKLYEAYSDKHGNLTTTSLDQYGRPVSAIEDAYSQTYEIPYEDNLLLLNIPTSL